ncbi:MAG: hypothetical protein COB30_016905 [Ectothiorhodospiraceae bacterium]|nr:hypothetical protein [Ectothiorhodospiraceae bacterium]
MFNLFVNISSKKVLKAVAISCLLLFSCFPVFAGSYAVIINADNTFSGDKQSAINTVKRLYLKIQSSWPSGSKVKLLARKDSSSIQKAFIKSILGMTDAELAAHWISVKQKTGETPPRSVRSGRIVIKLVEKNSGGVSFIESKDIPGLTNKAKVLFTF